MSIWEALPHLEGFLVSLTVLLGLLCVAALVLVWAYGRWTAQRMLRQIVTRLHEQLPAESAANVLRALGIGE